MALNLFKQSYNQSSYSKKSSGIPGYDANTPNNKTSCQLPLFAESFNQSSNIDFSETIQLSRVNDLVKLLSQHWLQRLEVDCAPVASDLITRFVPTHDITVRVLALKACHGAVWKINDTSWIIYVNKIDSREEQRITLFHEAFHILAHQQTNFKYRHINKRTRYLSEYMAEYFALHFLLPDNWLQRDWINKPNIQSLALKYQVPRSAVLYRLKELNLISPHC